MVEHRSFSKKLARGHLRKDTGKVCTNTYVDKALFKRLRECAEREDRSVSAILRRSLEAYVEKSEAAR